MTCLRNLEPLASTAAILEHYELAFDVPGNPLLEPSAASVRRRAKEGAVVHGVLYELTEDDFGRLGSSEGVPLVYRWEPCRVIPYVGDGKQAGHEALVRAKQENATPSTNAAGVLSAVDAFVLMASPLLSRKSGKHIPPSKSYLKVLRDGAAYWNMDSNYQEQLEQVQVSRIAPGVSDLLLQAAKRFNPK